MIANSAEKLAFLIQPWPKGKKYNHSSGHYTLSDDGWEIAKMEDLEVFAIESEYLIPYE